MKARRSSPQVRKAVIKRIVQNKKYKSPPNQKFPKGRSSSYRPQ